MLLNDEGKNIILSSGKHQEEYNTSCEVQSPRILIKFLQYFKNRYVIKHMTCDTNILNNIARIVVNSLPAKADVYTIGRTQIFILKSSSENVYVILFYFTFHKQPVNACGTHKPTTTIIVTLVIVGR